MAAKSNPPSVDDRVESPSLPGDTFEDYWLLIGNSQGVLRRMKIKSDAGADSDAGTDAGSNPRPSNGTVSCPLYAPALQLAEQQAADLSIDEACPQKVDELGGQSIPCDDTPGGCGCQSFGPGALPLALLALGKWASRRPSPRG